jgi:hypothetical protein
VDVEVPVDVDVDVSGDPAAASAERAAPEVPVAPATPSVNPEQEREAILRMIAEGRITPDEGDMLLEALDG